MKYLVLGCNGMAGHMITRYLCEQGHDVTGFARENSRFVHTVIGDARELELIRKTIVDGKYDAAVNCIGVLNQFAERNHEAAVFLNSYFPHYLASITADTQTQIIHISTDCVFRGTKGGYTEHDFPDGTLFYDRSKALGELIDKKNITLRTSIIGPDMKPEGIGLLNWFIQEEDKVKGYKNAIWTGQTTLHLAKTIENAVIQQAKGMFHVVPEMSISKYNLLCLFNKYVRNVPIEIIPEESFRIDKSLVRTNFKGFHYNIPDYETQVIELGMWMREHKELYPHYRL